MSVLSNLFGRIFHSAHAQQAPAPAAPTAQRPSQAAPAQPAPAQRPAAAPATPAAPGAQPAAAQASAPVDVEKILDGMAANNPQKLNWRHSIVDLMKLVGMESSLQERRELADELGYKGDKGDTAAMNTWLHKEVMKKMAENGGKVPATLLD